MSPGQVLASAITPVQQSKRIQIVDVLRGFALFGKMGAAAGGRARLVHGRREEVDVAQRPAIIKAYLQIVPGARPHIPIEKDTPLEAFEPIAPKISVFRVVKQTQ